MVRAWPKRRIRIHAGLAVALALAAALSAVVIGTFWIGVAGLVAAGVFFWQATRRYRKRRRVLAEPFPSGWRDVLDRRVPFYRGLDEAGRVRFEDDVRIFLTEQRIYGVHGVTVDESTRLLIAASAAMLGHGLPDWEWTNFRDIVVYPSAFSEKYDPHDPEFSGMVHLQGPVLLSRRELVHGFCRPRDGHNVALHELAHVMDMADGAADGVPAEIDWVAAAPWVELVADRLKKLRRGQPQALRAYAGENEAELFAVAVEAFFEKPRDLARRDPELYAMLAEYFNQDPAGSDETARGEAPGGEGETRRSEADE